MAKVIALNDSKKKLEALKKPKKEDKKKENKTVKKSKKTYVAIGLVLSCFYGCAKTQQTQPAPSCNPVILCNSSVKGAFRYDSGMLAVCAPMPATEKNAGEYAWQPVRWIEKQEAPKTPTQPQAPASPAK